MPQISPLYLRPVVGFAMWYLDRDESPEQVYNRLRDSKEYAGIRGDLLRLAIARAESNLAATARLGLPGRGAEIGAAFEGVRAAAETIGVRVVFEPSVFDAGLQNPSVTVNAPAGMSLSEVMGAAVDYAKAKGFLTSYLGRHKGVTYAPYVMQLIEGGLSAPALDLTGGSR